MSMCVLNSSNMARTQALAGISATEAQRFLTELANLRTEQSAVERFKTHFEQMIPPWTWRFGRGVDIPTRANPSRRSKDRGEQERERILGLRDRLRWVWEQEEVRSKEYGVLLICQELYSHQDEAFAILDIPPGPPPSPSPFEAALLYLLKAANLTRICGNSDCPARYFFASRRSQKYCSGNCALPAQQEYKRQWWAKAGKEWRRTRPRTLGQPKK